MLNKEKFSKEIIEIATKGHLFAIENETKIICDCVNLDCENCYFSKRNYPYSQNGVNNCERNIEHWANSEYIKSKKFTEQEKAVIKALDKLNWVAKDRNGEVYGFIDKPYKSTDLWKSDSIIDCIFLSGYSSCEFNSIKWEDAEPTSREEIFGGIDK